MLQQQRLDLMFHALGDRSRLSMVEALSAGPRSLGDLAEGYRMSLSGVGQHVKVLERAGVVVTAKVGRTRMCSIAPDAIDKLESWMRERRTMIEHRLDRLEIHLAGDHE